MKSLCFAGSLPLQPRCPVHELQFQAGKCRGQHRHLLSTKEFPKSCPPRVLADAVAPVCWLPDAPSPPGSAGSLGCPCLLHLQSTPQPSQPGPAALTQVFGLVADVEQGCEQQLV